MDLNDYDDYIETTNNAAADHVNVNFQTDANLAQPSDNKQHSVRRDGGHVRLLLVCLSDTNPSVELRFRH